MKISTKGSYYGAMRAEREMNGLLFSEYDYLDKRTDWHYHENPYFMYVLEGDLYDVNKKRKVDCPAGSFLLHNWQEPHFNTKESTHARGFHIEFDRQWFADQGVEVKLWEGSKVIKSPELHRLLVQLYLEFCQADRYFNISCELLITNLCDNLEKETRHKTEQHPPWLSVLIELIHDTDEAFSLQGLAEQLGVHPVHLSRAVPKYLSTTLGGYIRQVKTKKAIDLILSSNRSLTDIAYACGFADQSHFSRTFKQNMGMTPSAFRKIRRSG